MAIVGKNILENLTTGMYSDSKVIYREYIQNACDQIDKAIQQNIIKANEGLVDIFIDREQRYISIKDNATGVKSCMFQQDLGDIANSNKEVGKDKGFRGIGRLCGLAYCKTLKFSTSYIGETIKSIMICDAQKMTAMLNENKKYTLDEIWGAIVSFKTESAKTNDHFFEVELIEINHENTDLLDDSKVRNYLSFVAPVPYKNVFLFRTQISEHAKLINYQIDEYHLNVNGSQIFKEYTTRLKEKTGNASNVYDEISKLEFKDFYDDDGSLVAWMWVGLSRFEKQIPSVNQMRGLRLRSANIQLGGDNSLQELFKETRGNYYFVGEVFAVHKDLIPNSQRNYFNENKMRVKFEDLLKRYFYDVLYKIYYSANEIKNAYKRQEDYLTKAKELETKSRESGFVDDVDRQKLQLSVDQAKRDAENARKRLSKFSNTDKASPITEVYKSISRNFNLSKLTKKAREIELSNELLQSKKAPYITTCMSNLSQKERKLVTKILSIITDEAPKDVAEKIINRIKTEIQ